MYEWDFEVQKMIDWIEEHIKENPTLEDVSRFVHYSKFYCSNQFRNTVGMTLKRYIKSKASRNRGFLALFGQQSVTGPSLRKRGHFHEMDRLESLYAVSWQINFRLSAFYANFPVCNKKTAFKDRPVDFPIGYDVLWPAFLRYSFTRIVRSNNHTLFHSNSHLGYSIHRPHLVYPACGTEPAPNVWRWQGCHWPPYWSLAIYRDRR